MFASIVARRRDGRCESGFAATMWLPLVVVFVVAGAFAAVGLSAEEGRAAALIETEYCVALGD